jgi:hypothetical protein
MMLKATTVDNNNQATFSLRRRVYGVASEHSSLVLCFLLFFLAFGVSLFLSLGAWLEWRERRNKKGKTTAYGLV